MKKGFTMIELIFVIVILGILAAVAIPKLNATRDDAEVAKAATNLSTVINDLTAYYTAQGKFDTDMKKMTNVQLGSKGEFKIKNDTCVTITAAATDSKIVITPDATNKAKGVCKTVLQLDAVKSTLGGNDLTTAANATIDVGGSGISF